MQELNSNAEKLAKKACDLPAFRGLNLGGIKDQIAEMLSMIGRVQGIFSTYTKHDISHINVMLNLLDWLVPAETRESMTPVDWLMVVLSIYLHDLGMLVTSSEYEGRINDPVFRAFLDKLENDPEGKDYVARANNMQHDEKDSFLYQEFIRLHHASRIREWITGRHSCHWNTGIQSIADEIAKVMEDLPTRFREQLANICESHHKDNLSNIDIYPLYQSYGHQPEESANVQYAALLLRTVDLIHVTKDRTPSVMYKTITFSDLKSINEWEKQRGTFAVNMIGRNFQAEDIETHYIKVSADFSEERPFFALTEYLAWANDQIIQTKQWADKSRALSDGKRFWFPWRGVKGDIRVEGNLPRQMKFELDRGRLLNLLVGHTIYNDPTVAIRELLQNSIDAVRFQYYIDKKEANKTFINPIMGKVFVKWNPNERELVIQDTGSGMDLDIIQNHLLRVGSSFYDTPQFNLDNADFSPISRFGIGVLTCFMISDNIEIITCRSNEGRRIRMTSVHADYLLKDISTGSMQLEGIEPHGTKVRLILRPSVNLNQKSILDIVRQWVLLPPCDVFYSENNRENVKIGYDNTSDALHALCVNHFEGNFDSDKYDIITKNNLDSRSGQYDLSFMVVKNAYTSGRPFKSIPKQITGLKIAAVCIEGIRVDWHLPGFSPNIVGLLSVKDNRKFRTTVSRENLEQDEEYQKVAKLCAKSLFSHVAEEIARISKHSGNPLSQASTTGNWIYKSLEPRVEKSIKSYLLDLYSDFPLIVVEQHQSNMRSPLSSRSLTSINNIAQLPQFWTIESRTADYLGTISRDLGRELSINEFIGSLAPEILNSRVNPLIPDARLFGEVLRKSHIITETEFSRKHQQSLLKWEKPDGVPFTQILHNALSEQFTKEFQEYLSKTKREYIIRYVDRFYGSPYSRTNTEILASTLGKIMVAEVKGDLPGTYGILTATATAISSKTELAALWSKFTEAAINLIKSNCLSNDLFNVLITMYSISLPIQGGDSSFYRQETSTLLRNNWRSLSSDLEKTFSNIGTTFPLPDDINSLLGKKKSWFDASSYWWDWYKDYYSDSDLEDELDREDEMPY